MLKPNLTSDVVSLDARLLERYAIAKGELLGMLVTVPLGIPAPIVAETTLLPPAVTVAVVVAVVVTVVVNMVDVTTVWGGLLMTREFVPPMKLKIVPADS